MDDGEWHALLQQWSRELQSEWLGYPGATHEQIAAAESRLRIQLPPSYRSFLATTNGWARTGTFVDRLLPVQEIEWFAVRHGNWIDAWRRSEEFTWLDDALEVSESSESDIYLLNPRAVDACGEWEAWIFGTDDPKRFTSFRALMEDEHRTFLMLEAHASRRQTLDGLIAELTDTAQRYAQIALYAGDAAILESYAERVRELKRTARGSAHADSQLQLLAEQASAEQGEGHRKAAGVIQWFLQGKENH